MNKNNDEKLIHDMYEKIDTPEYDVSKDVIEKIQPKYHQKVVLKRVLIVAIILCLGAVALGAARIAGWQTFNLFGEKTGVGSPILPAITIPPGYESEGYTPIKRATPPPEDPEVMAYDRQFMDETEDDEVRISITDHGNGGYGGGGNSGVETEDLSKIEIIMNTNLSPIKIPSYIPEGYTFKKGNIDFYVDEKNLPELIYTEQINERTYWIYKLKEGYEQKVSKIELVFVNKNGDDLTFNISLTEATADRIEHHVSDSAIIETIKVTGFDEGIWVNDKKREYHPNQLSLLKEIPPISTIDLYNASFREIIGSDEKLEDDIWSKDIVYISMVCHIYADALDEKELIKIAESIN